jgi:hypothetical protein
MSLDSSSPSTGSASVEPDTQHPGRFIVDSFFDVFVDLTLDTPIPLQTTREAQLQLTAPSAVPEPASAGLLCGALLCLGAVRRSHFRRNHRSLGCETAI